MITMRPKKTLASFALSRFGVGGRPGDCARIQSDPYGWVVSELEKTPDVASFKNLPASETILKTYSSFRKKRQQAKKAGSANQDSFKQQLRDVTRKARAEIITHLRHSVDTQTPVQERLALFWSNHFTISGTKGRVRPIVTSYVREAIYPYINSTFENLLLAAISHPGMLIYLDNDQSIGPNSRFGRRRKKDINENLAREILELHTLGIKAGYSLKDIQAFAKILTGWTVLNEKRRRIPDAIPGKFHFVSFMHEPGTHKLMGKQFSEDGVKQGFKALKYLANHPSTAQHIATKLLRHFVSDTPTDTDIKAVAKTFLEHGGNLPIIHNHVFRIALEKAEIFKKARSPRLYFTAIGRMVDLDDKVWRRASSILHEMGQRPYFAQGPNGWGDLVSDWITPQSVARRINFAEIVAEQHLRPDGLSLMQSVFGDGLSDQTLTELRRAESKRQALAIALASPEMIMM